MKKVLGEFKMKYCSNCKISFDSGDFCPLCGHRESVFTASPETQPAAIVDASCCENIHEETKKYKETTKCKFNFSKLLCLALSIVFIVLVFFPCIKIVINGSINFLGETKLEQSASYSVFELQPKFNELVTTLSSVAPIIGIDVSEFEATIWAVNGILLCTIGYFLLVAFNFALFGIIGLFSRGKARYFFAKLGAWLGIIGNVFIIAATVIVNSILQGVTGDLAASGVMIEAHTYITAYPVVLLALLILFLTLGIRLLRYLNGVSCMNCGVYDIATREFKLARNFKQSRRLHKKCCAKPNRVVVTEKPDYIPEQVQ